jgi:hypothetical protein
VVSVNDTPFKAALDDLFGNTEVILDEFGDRFTFKEFLQTVTKRNQKAYIDLLVASRHNDHPFNVAHSHIGKRLSEIAIRRGYTKIGTRPFDDIFGYKFDDAIYQRDEKQNE